MYSFVQTNDASILNGWMVVGADDCPKVRIPPNSIYNVHVAKMTVYKDDFVEPAKIDPEELGCA
jgi:hypothetical protein